MKISRTLLNAALLTAAFIALPTLSQATPIEPTTETFQLTSDHCTGGCLGDATSAGTITVTDNGDGTLSFDVTLADGFTFVNGGFGADFGFNLNGNPTITYSNVSTGFTPVANPQSAGSLHMDGTGFFEYGLNCNADSTGCGNGGSGDFTGPLDFTISATTTLTLSSLQKNANNQFFAVDVQGNGNTGGVDASVGSGGGGGGGNAPEPQTLALLGIALVGASVVRARSRSKS